MNNSNALKFIISTYFAKKLDILLKFMINTRDIRSFLESFDVVECVQVELKRGGTRRGWEY